MTHFRARKDTWHEIDPQRASRLSDARLQLHHAGQFVAATGISYLPKADDDSHTNMEWIAGTLASNLVGDRPFRVGVRPHPFALASFSLDGKMMAAGTLWIQEGGKV